MIQIPQCIAVKVPYFGWGARIFMGALTAIHWGITMINLFQKKKFHIEKLKNKFYSPEDYVVHFFYWVEGSTFQMYF